MTLNKNDQYLKNQRINELIMSQIKTVQKKKDNSTKSKKTPKTIKEVKSIKKDTSVERKTLKENKEVKVDDSHLYEQSTSNTASLTMTTVATTNTDGKSIKLLPVPETKIDQVSTDEALVTDKGFVVVGNVDAGKSSLIGTLTTGLLDDGRGSARLTVAKHAHEVKSGRTSDISTRILRFPNGKTASLVDLCGHQKYFTTTATGIAGHMPDYAIVVASPSRGICEMTQQHFKMLMSYNIPVLSVITHIDMAQENSCKILDRDIANLCKTYKRTCEFMNDYNKYHAYNRGKDLAKKYDLMTRTETEEFDEKVESVIKKNSLTQDQIKDLNEYLNFDAIKLTAIGHINQGLKMAGGKQTYIPIIYVSNVDGYCLDVVKQSMMTIEPRDLWSRDENANSIVKFFRNTLKLPTLGLEQTHVGSTFYIDNAYTVKGVGLVVSGIDRGDKITVNDDLYIGPMNKIFSKIKIRSIHNDNREPVESLANHHRGCIAIKGLKEDIKKNQIARGMVLISNQEMIKHVCYRFNAAVTIFGGLSATLRTGYSPVIHAGTIRQTAKLILPDDEMTLEDEAKITSMSKRDRKNCAQKKIRSGAVEKVTFKFKIRPEYLEPGTVFVFRSGDIHGVGCVIDVIPLIEDDDAQPEPVRKKFRRIRPSDESKRNMTKKPGDSKMPEKIKVNVNSSDIVTKPTHVVVKSSDVETKSKIPKKVVNQTK